MKKIFSAETGRYWMLTACFILLAATLALIYLHPENQKKDFKTGDYENNTLDKWYSQAEFLLKRGDWDQAKNLALKILLSFPDDLFATRVMIRVCVEKGDLKEAENICRKIIYKNPEAALTRNNLAVILYLMNRPEAVNEIAIALRLMSEHPVIKYNFSKITGKVLPGMEDISDTPPDLLIVKTASNGEKS